MREVKQALQLEASKQLSVLCQLFEGGAVGLIRFLAAIVEMELIEIELINLLVSYLQVITIGVLMAEFLIFYHRLLINCQEGLDQLQIMHSKLEPRFIQVDPSNLLIARHLVDFPKMHSAAN